MFPPRRTNPLSPADRATKLSKNLSYVLRHAAIKDGYNIRPDGFIKVSELLASSRFKGYSADEICAVVRDNDKQRFTLRKETDATNTSDYWIKANQGQSMELERLELHIMSSPAELPLAVHGTFKKCWPSISKTGLKRMSRTHIHMALGLPGEDAVISGMRSDADVYIYINVPLAMQDGIVFEKSPNNVILSRGLDGVIPPKYFDRVTDSKGKIILPP
ncbi:hypothetical protein SeMB42_g07235 [Synchytrium endobioticum]|nr:hypothetical protein SeMB42_g07235 [Synchytrium endobioticum]